MGGEVVGHRHLPYMVVARAGALRHIVEEAQDASIFVIEGEEVVVHYAAVAAIVCHPLPSHLGRDVVAEALGQVGLLRALVPRQVHRRIACAPFLVGDIGTHSVVNVDGLRLSPVVGSDVLVVDVIVVGGSAEAQLLHPLLEHGVLPGRDGMEVYHPVFVLRLQTGAVVVERPSYLRSRQIVGSQLHIDVVSRHAVVAVGVIGVFFSIFSYWLDGAVLLIHQYVGPEALAVGIERTAEHHFGAFHGILA